MKIHPVNWRFVMVGTLISALTYIVWSMLGYPAGK